MILKRRWWWLLAALVPLLYLPLRAQETPPEQKPATAPAPKSEESVAEPEEDAPAIGEERVSADNNLSYPVDI
jgi:hypothetical protein